MHRTCTTESPTPNNIRRDIHQMSRRFLCRHGFLARMDTEHQSRGLVIDLFLYQHPPPSCEAPGRISLLSPPLRLKQCQWSVAHARGRAECRQCSRQNADNELQNRFPSLFLHRLNIKDSILDVSHRACSRSAKPKQAWFCSRLIAAFNSSIFQFFNSSLTLRRRRPRCYRCCRRRRRSRYRSRYHRCCHHRQCYR